MRVYYSVAHLRKDEMNICLFREHNITFLRVTMYKTQGTVIFRLVLYEVAAGKG